MDKPKRHVPLFLRRHAEPVNTSQPLPTKYRSLEVFLMSEHYDIDIRVAFVLISVKYLEYIARS
jgi:hypothetical protein